MVNVGDGAGNDETFQKFQYFIFFFTLLAEDTECVNTAAASLSGQQYILLRC